MESSSITILGGDLRQCHAAEYFCSRGWEVMCYHAPDFPWHPQIQQAGCLEQALLHSNLILAPTPLTQDGFNLFQAEAAYPSCPLESLWQGLTSSHTLAAFALPENIENRPDWKGCKLLTFGNDAGFTAENAALTAEGLLSEVIRCTPFALSAATILLLGYGSCGQEISKLVHPLCKKIYLIEQDAQKRESAKDYGLSPVTQEDLSRTLPQCQILINTVPAPVLEPSALSLLHSSCHLFDIASAPYGFPSDTTRKCLLPYYRLPGIPGRFSPVTAGEIIGRTIERMTEHEL